LALIARNAEADLPRLLASVERAFDEVVLVDTGSHDGTLQTFERWAAAEAARSRGFASRVAHFQWRDDFASARTFADSLLTTTWKVWADADDEIRGARRLRGIAAAAASDVVAFRAGYRYAATRGGAAIAYAKNNRLVRSGAGRWVGRVHEMLEVTGRVEGIPVDEVEWIHHKDVSTTAVSLARNMALLEKWLDEEPTNPRAIVLFAESLAAVGCHERALQCYERYLASEPRWGPARARLCRQMAITLMALERHEEALELARQAADAVPNWPDSYLTIAEALLHLGQPMQAIESAQLVLQIGPPDTDLVIKPLDYSVRPRMLIASALHHAGHEHESKAAAEALLAECFQ
jgi:tetratricopeptide (TPR) repeat protein